MSISNCTKCGQLYDFQSEEDANDPFRVCVLCFRKSLEVGMTAAEAERAFDSAPAIPISEKEVESLVDEIMGRKPRS